MQDFATLVIIAIRRKIQFLETAGFHRTNACAQVKRVMKLTGILILIACLHVSARGISQTISLSFENAPLETVLKDIEKQTGYTFFYRTNWVKQAKKVTIKASNLTLQQALELCFREQPVVYSIAGKIITITPKTETKAEENIETKSSNSLIDVKGRVVGQNGTPLEGVNVSVKGTKIGTTTNDEGEFFLNNINENALLLITNIGFEPATVPINGQNFINVALRFKVTSLEDIVVIGYGQITKRYNTGNVSSVKSTDIEKQPVNNPLLALAGRVPGLEVFQATGIPGSSVNIKIRGQNSILSGNDPLYVIDGVPYTSKNLPGLSGIFGSSNLTPGNPFSYINPADIESIEILKDADATAIYGSRGANGVILITTKKGKGGETRVSINAQTGFGKVPKKLNLLNTRQYLDMRYEAFKNDGAVPNTNSDFDLTLWDTTKNTDWQKELIGGTARYHDIQASVSGGNANTQILVGTGYHKETTVFPGNLGDQKASVHFNINNASNNKKFKISLSGLYLTDNNRLSSYDFTQSALTLPPNAPDMYNSDGSINWAPGPTGAGTWINGNPAAMLLVSYKTKTNNMVAQSNISYQILPRIELKSSFGYTSNQNNEVVVVPQISQDPYTWSTRQRSSRFRDNNSLSWIMEPQIIYSNKLFKGELKVLGGVTVQKNSGKGQEFTATGFNNDNVMEDIKSATSVVVDQSTNFVYRYSAVFGRINYNWQDKYLINLTGRRDGTSRFGPSKRFANFGAIGLGWIFTKEAAFKIPFLSFGKIRGSYGTTGNDQVGDYSYMDLYEAVTVGVPYFGTGGIRPTRLFTPDLAWEQTKKMEAALELGFLQDRIYLSVSSYQNRSNSQIINFPLSAVTGFTSINKNLNALIQNRGLEFEIRTQNISTKNLKWTSSLNVSRNWNKLLNAPEEVNADILRKVGYSLTSLFYLTYSGVDPLKGIYLFKDAHGASTVAPNSSTDRTYRVDFGNEFFGGIQNSISYKNFQLDFLVQFVQGRVGSEYLYYYIPGYFGYNQPTYVLNRWQKPGDVSLVQQFSQNLRTLSSFVNADISNQFYGDASFVRLKNVSFSWQLPDMVKKKLRLSNARIYAQGQNLYTITKYRGFDPETRNASGLPTLRVITFGLQVTI
jgi:TonB-dependent starch-binding outer membrane protein SusC